MIRVPFNKIFHAIKIFDRKDITPNGAFDFEAYGWTWNDYNREFIKQRDELRRREDHLRG